MGWLLKQKIKILIGILVVVILVSVSILYNKYPFGVKQYKTIKLGMQAAQNAGTPTYWAKPDNEVPESDFYVYAIGDKDMCIGSSCGIGGYFVECLGGYIAGEKIKTEEFDYGLRDAGVDIEKLKIITIANKDGKIIGIYPGAGIRNLPYIINNHRDLFSENVFRGCSDLLPKIWKS